MTEGISVLHFEDQHMDITPVVYEIYFILRAEALASHDAKDFKLLSEEKLPGVTVYDFVDLKDTCVPPVRYIVTSRTSFDTELQSLLFSRTVFVLDAWRENQETGALESNIETTFNSISGYYDTIQNVVIYTAYPGNAKRLSGKELPREFTKAGQEELETYLIDNVLGVWRNV